MMEKALNLDGFRGCLEKAIRVEEDVDWSRHTVDYASFKQRLKFFARRRATLRSLLRQSGDNRISEQVLNSIIGPKVPFPSPGGTITSMSSISSPVSAFSPQQQQQQSTTDYIPFSEIEKAASSDAESQASVAAQEAEGGGGGGGISSSSIAAVRRKSKRTVMRRVSNVERQEMILFLSWELDKAYMFYVAQWQKLSEQLELQRRNINSGGVVVDISARDLELGDELLELMAFCVINIVTVRQILIRYDAYARTFEGSPMLHYYMKTVTKHPTSFQKLLYHSELNAITDSYCEEHKLSPILVHFESQRLMFDEILASSKSVESVATTGHRTKADSFIYAIRDWFLLGAFEDRLGLEPSYLTMRGQSLRHEMERLAEWRKKKHEILQPVQGVKKLTGLQVFHLTLNLLSAFLYCMNYYIVEPSSTMYVNRLGAHDAMSGTLIGMMPLAAFFSSIPYSMWTNRSFRHPFIMSCFLLITGNLIYSAADRFENVWVALAGRFISGLGAPKCIIRRYMADTTPVRIRTSVNALFGMVVAAGSAMGPAMAIMLARIEYTIAHPWVGIVIFNGLTLPGYFMACLWFTFTVIVLLTFEEPDREGLQEQRVLEQQGAIPCSPSTSISTHSRTSDDELRTIFSGEQDEFSFNNSSMSSPRGSRLARWFQEVKHFSELITLPVRICLGLLFAKVFTIEALVSATSALSKNRYKWKVQQVGTLGFINGILVIPFSILVGRLSMSFQDHVLMKLLVSLGCLGLFLLIDISDLVATPTQTYNQGNPLAVSPARYIAGYFLAYMSIQSFEGVIGSTLSKVIPTALASGTFNSGLLATLVDTFGRACGDLFISAMGFLNLRQLMNLLFIPTFFVMLTCLVIIERCRDFLSV